MSGHKVRQCPKCKKTAYAGLFTCLDRGANWHEAGNALRMCPNCDFVTISHNFKVVADRHSLSGVKHDN